MTRDFRQELRHDQCWDRSVQALYEQHGEPLADCILQNREELIELCRLIDALGVRSYLELGAWTGRLVRALHRLFDFQLVAVCDDGWARHHGLPLELPPGALLFEGDAGSEAFARWRRDLGPVDLVLIDADHHYHAVQRDFELNRALGARLIALHDITGDNRHTVGVRRFWQQLDHGHKREIVLPHRELGLARSTMGIGVWSASELLPASRLP